MRIFNRIEVRILLISAFLLFGLSGCSPGPIVWRVDGDTVLPASPIAAMGEETAR
jgi:hypothetical protein